MIESNKNIDMGKTRINDDVRVSSAAIFYNEMFGSFYQLETWVFSENKQVIKSRMFIHETVSPYLDTVESRKWLVDNFHRRISNILSKKLNQHTHETS
jgi:hypothetical protein